MAEDEKKCCNCCNKGSGKLLKPSEVAERLGVVYQTLYRWAKGGRISYMLMPSGHMRFTEEQVESFLKSTSEKSADEQAKLLYDAIVVKGEA